MLFWTILIVVVLVMLLRLAPTLGQGPLWRETPLERLQRRYAAGELSTAEYEDRRRRLP